MSAESVLSVVTILILVPLCGVIFALTPWLTPKGELFSVSVPTAAASDPRPGRSNVPTRCGCLW